MYEQYGCNANHSVYSLLYSKGHTIPYTLFLYYYFFYCWKYVIHAYNYNEIARSTLDVASMTEYRLKNTFNVFVSSSSFFFMFDALWSGREPVLQFWSKWMIKYFVIEFNRNICEKKSFQWLIQSGFSQKMYEIHNSADIFQFSTASISSSTAMRQSSISCTIFALETVNIV